LLRMLAAGDDIGKLQRSIRCLVLCFKMFIMGVINRD
jgi:hypothetical protein